MANMNQPFYDLLYRVGGHLELLAVSIAIFFAPIYGILLTVAAFIVLDTGLGIWKSVKKGVPITSRGLSALISKLFLYEVVVLTTYLVDFFILNGIVEKIFGHSLLITKFIALTLVGIEVYSVNENFKEVRGVSIMEAMKKMVMRVKDVKDDVKETLK